MRLRALQAIFITAFLLSFPFSAGSQVQAASADAPTTDMGLCLPGIQDASENCLMAGPAARLQVLAEAGITFPEPQVFSSPTPIELANIPYIYGLVSNEEIPLYRSLEDIVNEEPSRTLIKSKIKYVSLIRKETTAMGEFYQIATDEWIKSDLVRRVAVPNFQGHVFKKNPRFTFGWVLDQVPGRSAPDYLAPETGTIYNRFQRVVFYDSRVVGDVEWVMVGPDEWLEHRYTARVIPSYNRPEGVTSDKWIEINLYEQVLSAYENGSLVFSTLTSSGVYPFYTKPGVFQVYKKLEFDPMSGAFELDKSDYYYLENVPYIMYYDDARAIHGAYWQSRLGYQNSHGCVNLSVADAHWIFNWANEGDYVYVHDPSGQTPTDPGFYKGGGY
jgi:hypothetical protein